MQTRIKNMSARRWHNEARMRRGVWDRLGFVAVRVSSTGGGVEAFRLEKKVIVKSEVGGEMGLEEEVSLSCSRRDEARRDAATT